ncbi:OmpA family protein [Pedobacter sp. SYP-B3415]|uniref:OmpA family protein n=1 Tax=Pedobacter sp. SYP-B3415 TaxID=2496641 RepID=UPI00101B9A75|nr:OmpA family protein [Pedobacter sp. SYP-B3415]
MKKFTVLTSLLSFLAITASAQYVVNYKKAADAYFAGKEYYAAAEFYKKALNIKADSSGLVLPYSGESKAVAERVAGAEYQSMIFKLAEANRLYKNFAEAEKYYALANGFADKRYSMASYWYGESLMANQKYDEAIDAYEKYIASNPKNEYTDKAAGRIQAIRAAVNEMRYPKLVQVKKLPGALNSAGSNYAPVFMNGKLYISSSRPQEVPNEKVLVVPGNAQTKVLKKQTPYLNALYEVSGSIDAGSAQVSKVKVAGIPKTEQLAAASFNPSGDRMYFTAWNERRENPKQAIFWSQKTGSGWSEPKALGLQVNSKDWNAVQPFVTPDGKFLIFSSDRSGGFGNFDLWYCPLRADGSLGQAVNMGPQINTADSERNPYYNALTRKLMFSSNNPKGLGGYDFYESEGDFTGWSAARNMGYPFNSSKDDVYFTATNSRGTEGYISSDRQSECCLELFAVKREFIKVTGQLIDCVTNQPISNAQVSLNDGDRTQVSETGADGSYTFAIDSRKPIRLAMKKDNYFSKNVSYNAADLAKVDTLVRTDLCLTAFKIDKPIVLNNIYYEFNSAELTEGSKVMLDSLARIMLDNPDIEIELSAHTDNIGGDAYNFDLSDRRAKSCVNYLLTKQINPSRVTSRGYGKTKPVAPNTLPNGKDNPDGRQKNRRTEFKVTKK